MQFAPCRHLTQPWHCDSWKTRNMTRLKCCACYAKWRWRSPKRCACHQKCKASSENVARVLRLPDKTNFDMLWNMLKCSEVPRLPRKRGYTTSETSKSDHFCRTRHRHGHTDLTRTLANGCGRLRTFANGCATSSENTLNPQTPRVKREPLLRIREIIKNPLSQHPATFSRKPIDYAVPQPLAPRDGVPRGARSQLHRHGALVQLEDPIFGELPKVGAKALK